MFPDQVLKSFINTAQDNQRLALCLVSRKLRETNGDHFDLSGVFDREERDIIYLRDNFHCNNEVKQIVKYLNTNPSINTIKYSDEWWRNKDFKDQDTIYEELKASADAAEAAARAAAAPPPRAAAAARAAAAPPPRAAVAPPPPAAPPAQLLAPAVAVADAEAAAPAAAPGNITIIESRLLDPSSITGHVPPETLPEPLQFESVITYVRSDNFEEETHPDQDSFKKKSNIFHCFYSLEPDKNFENDKKISSDYFLNILNINVCENYQKFKDLLTNKKVMICKMELNSPLKIGKCNLQEQHFIDIDDSENRTRIFIDKQGFNDLEKYKKDLTEKFVNFLNKNADISKNKDSIIELLNKFESIGEIENGGHIPMLPTPPTPTQTYAQMLDLNEVLKIDEYASELAENLLKRRIQKGNLEIETRSGDAMNYTSKPIDHIKIVRSKDDKNKIEVHKIGDCSSLQHVNLALSSNEIMQIETASIGANQVNFEYYKKNTEKVNFDNLDTESQKIKVELVSVDTNNKIYSTITNDIQEKDSTKNIFEITPPVSPAPTPLVSPAQNPPPTIFELDNNNRFDIGTYDNDKKLGIILDKDSYSLTHTSLSLGKIRFNNDVNAKNNDKIILKVQRTDEKNNKLIDTLEISESESLNGNFSCVSRKGSSLVVKKVSSVPLTFDVKPSTSPATPSIGASSPNVSLPGGLC